MRIVRVLQDKINRVKNEVTNMIEDKINMLKDKIQILEDMKDYTEINIKSQ